MEKCSFPNGAGIFLFFFDIKSAESAYSISEIKKGVIFTTRKKRSYMNRKEEALDTILENLYILLRAPLYLIPTLLATEEILSEETATSIVRPQDENISFYWQDNCFLFEITESKDERLEVLCWVCLKAEDRFITEIEVPVILKGINLSTAETIVSIVPSLLNILTINSELEEDRETIKRTIGKLKEKGEL